jgi:hypothetical protein
LLDFQKLIAQIVALGAESCPDDERDERILSLAQTCFEEARAAAGQMERILAENAGLTFWPTTLILEPFGASVSVKPLACVHSVVACDGSQIMPTQHEVHSCYLLNVGAACFHYGEPSRAQLSSFPHLYYRHEELYPLINHRRLHIDESLVGFERGLKELEAALALSTSEAALGHPVLTLVDGSLIPFNVEHQIEEFQQDLLRRYEAALEAFREARLPLLGYISHSRSSDVVNALRVWCCPYPESRCQARCAGLDEENFPCSAIWPLSDRQLFASKLPAQARSGFFLSGSRWSKALSRQNQICFAYLNIAQESARIEVPFWLLAEVDLLSFAFCALLAQVQKGHGYPVSLAEAHNMAVIRQGDRSRFFELVSQQLVRVKKTEVKVSPKESKKRRGFV